MKKIYCDTGGFRPEMKKMREDGLIKIIQFRYEGRNKHIKNIAKPSCPTWDQINYSWDELGGLTWDDLGNQYEKYTIIKNIIGPFNKIDIQHIDSACMSECDAFITSDKGDICSKSYELYEALGIRVFHFIDDWDDFVRFCTEGIQN